MKLSIIVVTYNVEPFIGCALKSCISDAADDIEVIVVDNRSTDGTIEVVREMAASYPRLFKVITNDVNYGLGIARNIGIQNASGDYLLFLDGDDWFMGGAIQRCLELLSQKSFEVLVFDYVRCFPDGKNVPNPASRLLFEGYRNTPRERAEIMQNFGVAWNKIYQKAFIDRTALRFSEGYYEDIEWNFACLMRATSYYVVPDILLHYRQRDGSITRSESESHFDIIDQYLSVLRELTKHGESAILAPSAYFYAQKQILNVLNSPNRLPRHMKSDFLRAAADLLSDFRKVANIKAMNLVELSVASRNLTTYQAVRNADQRLKKLRRAITKHCSSKMKGLSVSR